MQDEFMCDDELRVAQAEVIVPLVMKQDVFFSKTSEALAGPALSFECNWEL